MNAKTKKLALIGAAAVVLCAGIFMALQAFNENLVFFFSPTQVAAKEAPVGRTFASAAWLRRIQSFGKRTA